LLSPEKESNKNLNIYDRKYFSNPSIGARNSSPNGWRTKKMVKTLPRKKRFLFFIPNIGIGNSIFFSA